MEEISGAKLASNQANLLKARKAKQKKRPKSTSLESSPTQAPPPPKRALFGTKRVATSAGLAAALTKHVEGRAELRQETKDLKSEAADAIQKAAKTKTDCLEQLRRQRCEYERKIKQMLEAHAGELKRQESELTKHHTSPTERESQGERRR